LIEFSTVALVAPRANCTRSVRMSGSAFAIDRGRRATVIKASDGQTQRRFEMNVDLMFRVLSNAAFLCRMPEAA
jgi:hypothetical protein